MKRINRKKLITELSVARQGFASAILYAQIKDDRTAQRSFEAHHRHLDKIIVELGGETVGARTKIE